MLGNFKMYSFSFLCLEYVHVEFLFSKKSFSFIHFHQPMPDFGVTKFILRLLIVNIQMMVLVVIEKAEDDF